MQDVPELAVFQAVAAWCQAGRLSAVPGDAVSTGQQQPEQALLPTGTQDAPAQAPNEHWSEPDGQQQQQQQLWGQQGPGHAAGCSSRSPDEVLEVLQLVRFALMSDDERQVRGQSSCLAHHTCVCWCAPQSSQTLCG